MINQFFNARSKAVGNTINGRPAIHGANLLLSASHHTPNLDRRRNGPTVMSESDDEAPYCGNLQTGLMGLFASRTDQGIAGLFQSRLINFAFKTRVAIFKACEVLGLKPGDEVLAPSYNCGSEIDPLISAGLVIKLYAIDRQTRFRVEDVEALITPRTRAIYFTHYFGWLQPVAAELRALCSERDLFLIEDCSLSLLSGIHPSEGTAGDVALFCFHKFVPVPAGGALVINNRALPASVDFDRPPPRFSDTRMLLRMAAFTILGEARLAKVLGTLRHRSSHNMDAALHDDSVAAPDIPAHYYFDLRLRNARLGRLMLRMLDSFDAGQTRVIRRENAETYLELLDKVQGVRPLFDMLPADACPQCMPVLVNDRDRISMALNARGIASTPWWSGYHRKLDFAGFADACWLKEHVLALPCHQGLSRDAVAHVVETVRHLLA